MPGQVASGPKEAAYVRDGYGAFLKAKYECGCCEMLVLMVCGVGQNLYVFSLYRNPDLDDRIFDSLLASMAPVQAEDVGASFLFTGDLNGHHRSSWLLCPRTIIKLQPLTSKLYSIAISWLSAQPMHVVMYRLTDVPDLHVN